MGHCLVESASNQWKILHAAILGQDGNQIQCELVQIELRGQIFAKDFALLIGLQAGWQD